MLVRTIRSISIILLASIICGLSAWAIAEWSNRPPTHALVQPHTTTISSAKSTSAPQMNVVSPPVICNAEVAATETNPTIVSAATATVMVYCDHSATGTAYGSISDANYFSIGEVINGTLYITRASNPTTTVLYGEPAFIWPQNQIWIYRGSSQVKLLYSLPGDNTSSISAISVSPDESLIAIVLDGNELDIMTSSGTVLKSLPTGGVPLGWGRNLFWLEQGSQDGPGYTSVNLTNWSMNEYYPTEGIPNGDMSLNYDTGEMAVSDVPWFGDIDSYDRFVADSTATVSLYLDNLVTGATETIVSENIAVLGGAFDPEWLDDKTLQYDVSRAAVATTSVP